MSTSEITLDILRIELLDRMARTERRTQALESLLLRDGGFASPTAPLYETPTPTGVETPRQIGRAHV